MSFCLTSPAHAASTAFNDPPMIENWDNLCIKNIEPEKKQCDWRLSKDRKSPDAFCSIAVDILNTKTGKLDNFRFFARSIGTWTLYNLDSLIVPLVVDIPHALVLQKEASELLDQDIAILSKHKCDLPESSDYSEVIESR